MYVQMYSLALREAACKIVYQESSADLTGLSTRLELGSTHSYSHLSHPIRTLLIRVLLVTNEITRI